jgi:hypothetical protein
MQHQSRQLRLLTLCCSALTWLSCSNLQPVEIVPTYIHIDSFHFAPASGVSGLPATSSITNIKVYYNNNPIGSFDLPATIPVLASGIGTLSIAPGIIVDGLNDLTGPYPFYRADTFTFNAQPRKIISYTPSTSYYAAVKSHMVSDFTSLTGFGLYAGQAGMTIDSGAGLIQLNAIGDTSLDSSSRFSIPSGAAYIEFDYKCSIPFSVGMQSNLGGIVYQRTFLAGAYAINHWQKMYMDVTDFVGQYPGDSYHVFIRAVLDGEQSGGKVWIDNICLVSF